MKLAFFDWEFKKVVKKGKKWQVLNVLKNYTKRFWPFKYFLAAIDRDNSR